MNNDHHSLQRRSQHHDYNRPGIYHITLHVAEGRGAPLGTVVGNPEAPDGHPDAPRVALTPVGQMVEQELLAAIPSRYPMVAVQDHIVMPDHLHFLLVVKDIIISPNGKRLPLGQVIAGFKKGCNKRFWAMTGSEGGQTALHTPPAPRMPGGFPASAHSVSGGFPAGTTRPYKVHSDSTSGRPPLFSPGYCDVMPVDAEQLATQRAYIRNNPRSRLLRTSHRDWLMPRRGAIATALTLSALMGYLRRECAPSQASPEALTALAARLHLQPSPLPPAVPSPAPLTPAAPPSPVPAAFPGGSPRLPLPPSSSTVPAAFPGGSPRLPLPPSSSTVPAGFPGGSPRLLCDSYGDRALLDAPHLLPVICHRRDKLRFAEQKTRCLAAAAAGAVLVSPRIAKGEQEIMDAAVHDGFPVVLIHDNGFPDRYHPSTAHLDLCAAGRLLLVTPWRYRYRGKQEAISEAECKTMNCLAQALCRTKDDWWKK